MTPMTDDDRRFLLDVQRVAPNTAAHAALLAESVRLAKEVTGEEHKAQPLAQPDLAKSWTGE